MDTLTLAGMCYHGQHGLTQKEQQMGNDFEVDLIFETPLIAAGETDELRATIDYQQAEQTTSGVMHGSSVKLIETLVARIGEALFSRFDELHALTVRVRKLHPPIDAPTRYAQVERTWKR